MVFMQQTLINSVIFKGTGLHSGEIVTMTVSPAMADEGIRFIRKDVDGKDNVIPARYDLVEESQLCTRLINKDGVSVSTIEHVMAALAGMGIDNATLIIDGPEVPIMDGSALPFITEFEKIGVESLNTPRQAIKILKTIEVSDKHGALARFEPDAESVFEFSISFDNKFIAQQSHRFTLNDNEAFKHDLACSPTFTTKDQVDFLRAQGLIKGGAVENADIYADDAIYRDTSRPRKDKAAVRHKLLDAVGDCALAGAPIIGKYTSDKGGHAMTNRLLRKLFDDPTSYMIIEDHLGIGQAQQNTVITIPKPAYQA